MATLRKVLQEIEKKLKITSFKVIDVTNIYEKSAYFTFKAKEDKPTDLDTSDELLIFTLTNKYIYLDLNAQAQVVTAHGDNFILAKDKFGDYYPLFVYTEINLFEVFNSAR